MGKQRFMKFMGSCQVVKTVRKGKQIETNMKCPGNKKISVKMDIDILKELNIQ